MNGLFEAALEVQTFMLARSWSFCLIGGLAVIRWGEPRMTQDVDLSLLTGFGQEDSVYSGTAHCIPGTASEYGRVCASQ